MTGLIVNKGLIMTDGLSEQIAEQAVVTAPEEKQHPQSYVNKIVGHAKSESFEKGMKSGYERAMQELQEQQAQAQQQQYQPQQSMGGFGQSQGFSPDQMQQLSQIIQQTTQQQQMENYGRQMLGQFQTKMEASKAKYPDFEMVTAPLRRDIEARPEVMAGLVNMVNATDNTGDIMYDLSKNPGKVANLITLLHTAPNMAQEQVALLSKTIQQNQSALQQEQSTRDPLLQIKPSTTGTDNGAKDESKMSASDFKKMSFLRRG